MGDVNDQPTGDPPARRGSLADRMRHAFAVDPSGPATPTPEQQEPVDWFCRQVAMRHLTTPGIIALEMSRPLNWVGAQLLHCFGPGVWSIVQQQTYQHYKHFATFLEHRGSLEYMARRIEEFEAEFDRASRTGDAEEQAGTEDSTGQSRA